VATAEVTAAVRAAAVGAEDTLEAAFVKYGTDSGAGGSCRTVGGAGGNDAATVTRAVKSLAAAAAGELSLRGLLRLPPLSPPSREDAAARHIHVVAVRAAAVAAAEELCDNSVVIQRVLALPTAEELSAASESHADPLVDAQNRWVYLVWGKGGGNGASGREGGGGGSGGGDSGREGEDRGRGFGGGRGRGRGGGGYRVRPGDSISYEVKWYTPVPIDPEDPISGGAPGAGGVGSKHSEQSRDGDDDGDGNGGDGGGEATVAASSLDSAAAVIPKASTFIPTPCTLKCTP
jgi:hypothetical protein